ncbi:MAG: hypothetical protein CME62_15285 [Halobacteriovoraceae bacterium]|nr:hypothetical protein [Halobacteriovoraceae bacterium]
MQVQDSQSGSLNSFELKPYLSAALDYQIKNQHFLGTEVGYILRESYSKSTYTKDHFYWRFDYIYQALEWFNLRAGTSFMWQTLSGDGSEETLPNGDGEQTYYAPDERKNIFNQTFDLGVEFLHKNMSARIQSYIYALDQEDERLTSFSLSFHYLMPIRDL